MRLTIRRQVAGLAAAGFILVLAAGVIGFTSASQQSRLQRTARDSAAALGAVKSADTARAAFRGDVLAALVTTNSTERQAVLDRLGDEVRTIRTGFDDVVRYLPDMRGRVSALDAPLDAYIAAGQRVVTLSSKVASDPQRLGALAARPAFDAQDAALVTALHELESGISATVRQTTTDAENGARRAQLLTLVTAGLAALVLGGIALVVTRRIARRIAACVRIARSVAARDLTVEATIGGNDEMAELAASLNAIVGSLRAALSEIADNAHALSAASEQLTATSRQLADGAGTASAEAQRATEHIDHVTRSVAETTGAAQGMRDSIGDITEAVTEAGTVAEEAVQLATSTNRMIERLRNSSNEVSSVVNMITTIAEQTNLLALNATIEAARAGDQGKGFAVVAGEVKELSRETAQATEDIGARVDAMQTDTAGAIETITRISEVIARIDQLQRVIAGSVEVQTEATRSIAGSVEVASTSSAGVVGSISTVANATQLTFEGATNTQAAATELAQLSHRLRNLVGEFSH
jgi:methyl-accepting chemotaxis protein